MCCCTLHPLTQRNAMMDENAAFCYAEEQQRLLNSGVMGEGMVIDLCHRILTNCQELVTTCKEGNKQRLHPHSPPHSGRDSDPNNNNNSENTQEKEEAKEVAGDAESASDPIDPKDTDSASLANGLLTENGNPASVKEEEGNLSQYLLSEHLTSPNDGFPCKKDLAQISLQDMAAQTNSLVSTLLQITSDMSDSERRAPLPRFYAVSAGTHIRTYTIFLL